MYAKLITIQNIFTNLGFASLRVNYFQLITISLAFGIFWQYNNFSIIFAYVSFLILFLFSFFVIKENKLITMPKYLIIFFIFSLGAYIYQSQINKFDELQNIIKNKKFDLIGVIDEINFTDNKLKNCITINLESIKDLDAKKWINLNNKIQIHTNKLCGLQVDDKIRINNVLFNNIKNNSFKNYLIKEDLISSVFLYKFSFKKLFRPDFSLKRWFHKTKVNLFYKLKEKMKPESFNLFSSIFLGNKSIVKKQMEVHKQKFKIWGLSHYLARSGLHLVIIIGIWQFFMSAFGFTFYLNHIIGLFLIIIYNFLSWSSIPFIRSLFMIILYKFCIFFDLQINTLHLLNIITFTILFFNPIQLTFLDFQLSFGLTYALVWISFIS